MFTSVGISASGVISRSSVSSSTTGGSSTQIVFARGISPGSAVQERILKQPRSVYVAVSTPMRSTHPNVPWILLAVSMFHAVVGTPSTSR